MSIESISKRLNLDDVSKYDLRQCAGLMLMKMENANSKGANNEAEIEDLEYAMNGRGDLMLALERSDLWLKNKWDDK